jgi:PIN domain nuclease of toxin-antitoxin system
VRLLLDTNVVLAILHGTPKRKASAALGKLLGSSNTSFVSAASLWEIAIKTRLGKLDPGMQLEEVAFSLEALDIGVLIINAVHAVTAADPEPATRDPFDRLLLAQCQVEGLKLVTTDRVLANHPLALNVE